MGLNVQKKVIYNPVGYSGDELAIIYRNQVMIEISQQLTWGITNCTRNIINASNMNNVLNMGEGKGGRTGGSNVRELLTHLS